MLLPKRLSLALTILAVLLTTACTTGLLQNPVVVTGDRGIAKSPNDQRDYSSITLDNGLSVMLISDPATDKAAASLDVYVGSADDPEAFPGLAHFLEHMLFLGTKQYPEPDAYQKFISEHGGSHNAFTSSSHTNYFFDISAPFLEDALDRFSNQFTDPLFNEDYVEREVNAVHSEFSSKLKSDGRRFFAAVKQTLAAGHPYRNFAVGNLDTLKDTEDKKLRDALLEFYDARYSANQMRLVVLGQESLEQLEIWVTEKFSGIPDKQLEHKYITQDFFDEGFLPAKLEVQTIMDTRSMGVSFPIPSPSDYKDSQPASYIANLIGHEGKGSLLSALKAAELVDSLSAGTQFDTQKQAIFMVNMSLTQKGLAQPELILEHLFAYIDLIKQQGLKKLYFDEQVRMLEIGFAYQEKIDPIRLVRSLSTALHESTPETVLFEDYDLNTYDEELYLAYLNHLTPDDMLVTLSAQSIKGEQKTPHFQAPYTISKLDPELLTRLSNPKTNPALAMPSENIFIPNDISLIADKNDLAPKPGYQGPGISLWHAANTEFGTPKANLFVTLRSPEAMKSATSLNEIELMVALLKDALNEYSYPAYLAGLNYDLYNHMRGITIKIRGYNDKQGALLNQILTTFKSEPFKQERFDIIKERLQRSIENEKDQKPYEQAIAASQRALVSPSWTPEERLLALAPISLDELETFRQKFLKTLEVAVLSHGNVSADKAQTLAKNIENSLLKGVKTTSVERSSVVNLPDQKALLEMLDVAHPDTGFVYYLQGDSRSYDERALYMLLAQIMSSDYYAQIRTDKQLGYIVFATFYPTLEVPGLAFIVQSPNTSGEKLLLETDAFLDAGTALLKGLDEQALERFKTSLISRLSKQDNNLYEKSNRYWREIDRRNYDFDTREQLIESVRAIKTDSLSDFYQQLMNTTGNRLVIFSNGNGLASADEKTEGYTPLAKVPESGRAFFPHY